MVEPAVDHHQLLTLVMGPIKIAGRVVDLWISQQLYMYKQHVTSRNVIHVDGWHQLLQGPEL